MALFELCLRIDEFFALPATILFLGTGIFLTFLTRFVQIRRAGRVFQLIKTGVKERKHHATDDSINPIQALLTAMATTIGMGNIVGPSVAIVMGGPGALFWLVAYAFLGSVTKFTEVVFALSMRTRLPDGSILGGPTQYLKQVCSFLARWYAVLTVFLFAGWSGLQANTLANIFYLEGAPKWATGLALALLVFVVLRGGIQRIGMLASKLVPLMFVLYVLFSLSILLQHPQALVNALKLM